MLRILTVVGARPQFIKAAVISRLLRSGEYSTKMQEYLVHTGQHYDDNMSAVFFREMEIPSPDCNLEVCSGSHGAVTGAMLARLEEVMLDKRPDAVLVYGDTNSTLAGALAASKIHIPVIHVESGLRSFMMAMPEEQNRIVTDRLSTLLFCPTKTAIQNLQQEGIVNTTKNKVDADNKGVYLSGDVMYDASLYYREKLASEQKSSVLRDIMQNNFYLITIHRAENTDNPKRLSAIVEAINQFDTQNAVLPLHPRTRKYLDQQGLTFKNHVHLIEPVGYFDMLRLESSCEFIVTDSGGVQKEAYFFKKPCITLRDSTEWVELCDHGWNTLAGADTNAILDALTNMPKYGDTIDLYGDGKAGRYIVDKILEVF